MENWITENGKLGGPGLTVEVDESHVWTNKYARGRLMANQRCHFWLSGARCKETQQVYLEHTMIRDSAACESFCGRVIHPLSNLHSDYWGGYSHVTDPQRMAPNPAIGMLMKFYKYTNFVFLSRSFYC